MAKVKGSLCSLLTALAVSLSSPSCAPSYSVVRGVQSAREDNNYVTYDTPELVFPFSISTSTRSNSVDTVLSSNSYDKNDNNITTESINKIEAHSVFVLVNEKIKCAKVAFYEKGEYQCRTGKEFGSSSRWGSGLVLVNESGTKQVVTNNHLLPEDNDTFSVFVIFDEKKKRIKVEVTVSERDYERDLVLLSADGKNDGYLPPAYEGCIGTHFSRGDFLKGVGYSATGLSVLSGRIHSIPNKKLLGIEGAINNGNSGGAVYSFDNGEPKLVGILTMKNLYGLDGVGGAVSSHIVKNFLKDIDKSMARKYACKDEEKEVESEE